MIPESQLSAPVDLAYILVDLRPLVDYTFYPRRLTFYWNQTQLSVSQI